MFLRKMEQAPLAIESPAEMDILCGNKSKAISRHPGNMLLQEKVQECVDGYEKAKTKQDRILINRRIIQFMQTKYGSRFLKRASNGSWIVAEDQAVRDKVSHAIRNATLKKQKERDAPRQLTPDEIRKGYIDDDVEDAEFVKMISNLYRRQQQIFLEELAQDGDVRATELTVSAMAAMGLASDNSAHGGDDSSVSATSDTELSDFLGGVAFE